MPRKNKQKITPRALMELKMPGDIHIAPDGLRIAYSVSETDWDGNHVSQHLYVTTTAPDAEPRQLTRGTGDESQPCWSPDGKWLAFLTSRETEDDYDDDDEPKQQVFLLPMDGGGGEAEKLTDAREGVAAYDWLPDSSGIVYLAREPRRKPLQAAHDDRQDNKDDVVVERLEKFRYQIWRIDRENKKARLVHPGDLGIGEIAVAPDGKSVAYTTNYTGEVNDYHQADLWTVSLDGGETRQLTDGPGGKFHPVWSPDSRRLLFVRSLDPHLSYSQENLFAVTVESREVFNLTQDFPHDIAGWHGVWHDTEGRVYFLAAIGTTTALYRLDGDTFAPVVEGDEHIHDFHVAPDGGVAFVASSTEDVPELLWLAPKAKRPETLTDLNEDWAEKYDLALTDVVSWKSADGLEIEGLLTYPGGYAEDYAFPLIVSLHGGPHGRTLQALSPYTVSQVFAGQGYAVLSPNYRGSEGYGNDFGIANRNDLGGGDYRDVMAGVDWAISEGIADPDRLAVMGASYGGYLTNWIIGHTDRFKAAVSEFGIFSLVTDFSQSQAPRWEAEYLDGQPWERPDAYAAQSPATYLQNINTPVLIIHGEGDANTFIANSQEMYQALHLRGKTVQYAHYPREGHGIGEPEHRLDEMRRILNWLDLYVIGGGKRQTYRIGDKIVHDGWELTVTQATLPTYAGRGDDKSRYVEVTFILRDTLEAGRPLSVTPADLTFARSSGKTPRRLRPVGLPIDVLGQAVLAEGTGWRFDFQTPTGEKAINERGLAVPLAVTFRLGKAVGEHRFTYRDFPPVIMDVPPADDKDADKKDDQKPTGDGPG
jgi:dipeptidyl aminopeptidase/acylaminoacyl peptidase